MDQDAAAVQPLPQDPANAAESYARRQHTAGRNQWRGSRRELCHLGGIVAVFLLVATYQIDQLPGEWFGDISLVNMYVSDVLAGNWPFIFSKGHGPFYHYLIAPFVYVFGINYLTYKLASIAVGTCGLIGIYLFTKEFSTKRIAYLTTMLTALSFWYLAWSRLGNFNITTPALTAFMMYFFIRYVKEKQQRHLIPGILIASLGLFTYPGVFLLPVAFIALLIYAAYYAKIISSPHTVVLFTLIGFLPAILLFATLVRYDQASFTSGFIGSKLFAANSLTYQELLSRLGRNIYRTALMLHREGDIIFRVNVRKQPHIDRLSGIFFIIGLWSLWHKKKQWLAYILIPTVLLLLPSISPTHPPAEIPNSARTMAIIPFVFLLIALGLETIYTFLRKRINAMTADGIMVSFVIIIFCSNLYSYFVLYPEGLPSKNTPFGRIIADVVNTLPEDTKIYLTACCWGAWGQPEPDGIYYALRHRPGRETMLKPDIPSCEQIGNDRPVFIIFRPDRAVVIERLVQCFPHGHLQTYEKNGFPVFTGLYIEK